MADALPTIAEPIIWVNVGSNLNPIEPPSQYEQVGVLVFEPIVFEKIKPRPRQYVVPAAVSNADGEASMGVYNVNGLSSSLSSPAPGLGSKWTKQHRSNNTMTVRTIALATVLEKYRGRINFLKTDMQGHDLAAIKSAGSLLRTVPYIMAEASIENQHAYGTTDENAYCDQRQHLASLGYRPTGLSVAGNRWLLAPAGGLPKAREYCRGLEGVPHSVGPLEGNGFWHLELREQEQPTGAANHLLRKVMLMIPSGWPGPQLLRGARNETGGLRYIDGTGYVSPGCDMMSKAGCDMIGIRHIYRPPRFGEWRPGSGSPWAVP